MTVMAVLKPLPLFLNCDRCYISREDYSETESLQGAGKLDELIVWRSLRGPPKLNFKLDQTRWNYLFFLYIRPEVSLREKSKIMLSAPLVSVGLNLQGALPFQPHRVNK